MPFCLTRGPSNRPIPGSKPLAQQRRLSIAGGRRDQRHLGRVYALVEALDQTGAKDQVWSGGGKIEFGLQKRCGHFTNRVAEGLNGYDFDGQNFTARKQRKSPLN
jgi:hypothetical protein